ncbi:MAG: aminopeptidase P family protein [Lachnospiraceae bacterium]
MTVKERVEMLRALMKREGMDVYVVPTDDYHGSEYVGKYFEARKFMTGFTGSAGVFAVTKDFAGLWTDGRYFLQAASQLAGSDITLMKMGEEGVPGVSEFIGNTMQEGETLGFDGRVISAGFMEAVNAQLKGKTIRVSYDKDLVDEIWTERPQLSCEPVRLLDEAYSGISFAEKLTAVREQMSARGAEALVLTALDDIAWLFNFRGNDIAYNPVALSYAVVTLKDVRLFIQKKALDEDVCRALEAGNVTVSEYNDVYEYVKTLAAKSIWVDDEKMNYALMSNLPAAAKLIKDATPATMMKSVKNETEKENLRKAHLKDGVAVTKFMYWFKQNVGRVEMDELSVDRKLESYREAMRNYVEPSFSTIAGYGDHGAVIHYAATEESNAKIRPEGLLLIDSGGHYLEGTTDITRTFAAGPVTEEMKKHFTLVLKGNLNLAAVKFLYGCTGANLDAIARGPLWAEGLDYKHGTGHGVGYLLSVHESPNRIAWNAGKSHSEKGPIEEGRVLSNEPGLYFPGKYGIRLENLMLCRKAEKNEYGQFMEFETLTLVPFDLDAVDASLLSGREKMILNDYHAEVYEKLSPYMTEEEKVWLAHATRAV